MKKQYKIFGLILALALLVCSVVALSASAEDSLAIEYANVAYNKMTQLAFTIKGTPAEGAEVGLAYWGYDVTGEKTLDNATVSFEKGNLDGKTYWLTPGIPASVMSEKVTVAPVTRDAEGKATITMMIPASVKDAKEWMVENFGGALMNLKKVEEALPAVVAQIAADKQAVEASIEV